MPGLPVNLKVRVDRELAAALERQAEAESRPVSQLIRNALREAMVSAGQLEAAAHRG
jgi:predicted transcriptional regulator